MKASKRKRLAKIEEELRRVTARLRDIEREHALTRGRVDAIEEAADETPEEAAAAGALRRAGVSEAGIRGMRRSMRTRRNAGVSS